MKKLLVAALANLFIATPVFAKENTLYIFNDGGSFHYDSALIDDQFMVHENMIPGESYTDKLTIENSSSKTFDIYFKITSENNSDIADDLLDYLDMDIFLNGKEYYSGRVKGLDYKSKGVNLTDAVLLKQFVPDEKASMRVELRFREDYSNISNGDVSKTKWHFYAVEEKEEPEEITPNPRTEDTFTPWYFVIFGMSFVILVGFAIWKKRENKARK